MREHRIRSAEQEPAPKFLAPAELAQRWRFHPESVRRLLRRGQIESVVISRRRLIPFCEILRVEAEGRIARAN